MTILSRRDILKKKENVEYIEFLPDRNDEIRSGQDQKVRSDQNDEICAIFFHGYGANAHDLCSFHSMDLPLACRWIFPNGFLRIEEAYNNKGRFWFPISRDFATSTIQAKQQSIETLRIHKEKLLSFIKGFCTDPKKIVLGGFSQGAIMALHLALEFNPPPRALVFLSGCLFPKENLNLKKKKYTLRTHFFQSHGKSDPLLPYALGEEAFAFLQGLGWEGKLNSFEGEHEIPQEIFLQLQIFLRGRLV